MTVQSVARSLLSLKSTIVFIILTNPRFNMGLMLENINAVANQLNVLVLS